ncbi:hypothetical protein GYB57_13440 [bacterium]|nr:hypothetical protein [bacterium]
MDSARYDEILNSDLIFIGEVIEINIEENYSIIQPIEVFKSDQVLKEPIKINIDIYCEPIIYSKGKWLIYASFFDDRLMVNVCGLTRSFKKPDENRYFQLPPPPPPPSPKDTVEVTYTEYKIPKYIRLENRKTAIKELEKEVEILRENN